MFAFFISVCKTKKEAFAQRTFYSSRSKTDQTLDRSPQDQELQPKDDVFNFVARTKMKAALYMMNPSVQWGLTPFDSTFRETNCWISVIAAKMFFFFGRGLSSLPFILLFWAFVFSFKRGLPMLEKSRSHLPESDPTEAAKIDRCGFCAHVDNPHPSAPLEALTANFSMKKAIIKGMSFVKAHQNYVDNKFPVITHHVGFSSSLTFHCGVKVSGHRAPSQALAGSAVQIATFQALLLRKIVERMESQAVPIPRNSPVL
ncbi:hypothetical protein D915_003826 [Fasciola hepatica]|uniref:Uncharacterized protein n=1 Tax=Fasciola hepatica TaxID=6192 RepID=A0A4E0R723_FASHE|nr:hypothetical protein D915_003826 [Fasciola hepatica]